MSERKAKAKRRAEIPPHVHCFECQRAVAMDAEDERDKPRARTAWFPKATPEGIGFMERQVPVCPECDEGIKQAQREAAKPKLVVPKIEVAK